MKAARRRAAPENPDHRRVDDDDMIRTLTINLVRTIVGLPWPQQFELVRRLGLSPVPASPEADAGTGDDLPADLLASLATMVRDASWMQDYTLGPLIWRPIAKALRLALVQLAGCYFPEAACLHPPEDIPDLVPSLKIDVRRFLAGADLAGADLAGADLTRTHLTRTHLTGANLTSANLTSADLTGANLTDAYLVDVDLTDADLTGAKLARADLTGATLTGVKLIGAYLAGVKLIGAYLADADLTDADLTGANLTNAYLASTDLADVDLMLAYLASTDLAGAKLTDADLTDIRTRSPRPKGAILADVIGLPTSWGERHIRSSATPAAAARETRRAGGQMQHAVLAIRASQAEPSVKIIYLLNAQVNQNAVSNVRLAFYVE
ncbi:pentapeptide repeat-containing protein [Planomonospora sp. ID91781]|uniref:pentapeptide repeat-containing protein n=1 Tax=Planomonospora sp. ID91781 TaxID=2738135 RepID=UPI0018C443CD|nr:pentapeptide repeat-containing protein [Planomonospora sp. ID91781]MBG0826164.1 pentapeptide repeat-containing protein [Planomonospora sp. ID91781]